MYKPLSQYSQGVRSILQKDGDYWFNLRLNPNRNKEEMSERFEMSYNEAYYKLWTGEVGISPHSWYHQCTRLHTNTGHLTVVVNGKTLHHKIDPFFVNSSSVRPESLTGRISLMRARDPGFWYQARQNVTNVNIFTSLSLADMISLTSEEVCDKVGEDKTYLAWADMTWTTVGQVTNVSVEREQFCRPAALSSVTLFAGTDWRERDEWEVTCPRLLH